MFVVRIRHNRAHIFFYQLRIFLHRFGDGTENHARFMQLLAERRDDGNTVEHGIDRDPVQHLLLAQGDTEFFIGFQQFWVKLIKALGRGSRLWRGKIKSVLIIQRRKRDVRPLRLRHGKPVFIGFQARLQQPLRLAFFCRNKAHDLFAQTFRREVAFNIRDKPGLVFLVERIDCL